MPIVFVSGAFQAVAARWIELQVARRYVATVAALVDLAPDRSVVQQRDA